MLHKVMNTFNKFLETKLFSEVGPAPAPAPGGAGGIGAPGALPPAGGAPPMGGGMPPMGGGMGGAPPMGGMPGAPGGGGQAPNKLKAYNVWDVLERVLGDESDQTDRKG